MDVITANPRKYCRCRSNDCFDIDTSKFSFNFFENMKYNNITINAWPTVAFLTDIVPNAQKNYDSKNISRAARKAPAKTRKGVLQSKHLAPVEAITEKYVNQPGKFFMNDNEKSRVYKVLYKIGDYIRMPLLNIEPMANFELLQYSIDTSLQTAVLKTNPLSLSHSRTDLEYMSNEYYVVSDSIFRRLLRRTKVLLVDFMVNPKSVVAILTEICHESCVQIDSYIIQKANTSVDAQHIITETYCCLQISTSPSYHRYAKVTSIRRKAMRTSCVYELNNEHSLIYSIRVSSVKSLEAYIYSFQILHRPDLQEITQKEHTFANHSSLMKLLGNNSKHLYLSNLMSSICLSCSNLTRKHSFESSNSNSTNKNATYYQDCRFVVEDILSDNLLTQMNTKTESVSPIDDSKVQNSKFSKSIHSQNILQTSDLIQKLGNNKDIENSNSHVDIISRFSLLQNDSNNIDNYSKLPEFDPPANAIGSSSNKFNPTQHLVGISEHHLEKCIPPKAMEKFEPENWNSEEFSAINKGEFNCKLIIDSYSFPNYYFEHAELIIVNRISGVDNVFTFSRVAISETMCFAPETMKNGQFSSTYLYTQELDEKKALSVSKLDPLGSLEHVMKIKKIDNHDATNFEMNAIACVPLLRIEIGTESPDISLTPSLANIDEDRADFVLSIPTKMEQSNVTSSIFRTGQHNLRSTLYSGDVEYSVSVHSCENCSNISSDVRPQQTAVVFVITSSDEEEPISVIK